MAKAKTTKINMVRKMLHRKGGVTIDAISKATGWQAHSVRAALSGLRKTGEEIERIEGVDGDPARYRMTSGASDRARVSQ